MSTLNNFNTWDDVASYIDNTMGIKYTDNPTAWVDAMKELTKGYKYVSVVNDVTGETTTQLMKEDLVSGVGEFHIGENTSSSSSTISGGGIKSAPTAKSIITNSSGGGTAVITDEAVGVKDTGLLNGVKGINIFNGLLQIYGLIHTGVKIANAQVWKDMSNYVYDSDFTEDTPLERVIEFLTTKVVNTVTDITSDGDLRVSIPDTIAKRMYEFLSNHMIQAQAPGIYPSYEGMDLIYNFITRTLPLVDPAYTLARYKSVSNPTDTIALKTIDITDDLFKQHITNFIEQVIGSGFLVSSSVATALLASMDGIVAYLKEQSVDACDNATLETTIVSLYRGSYPPTKETPVSLSEFRIDIYMIQNDRIPKTTDLEGNTFYDVNFNHYPDYMPALESGYSYQAGDNVKYLPRGKTGESANDYAYYVKYPNEQGSGTREYWGVQIRFPSNEKTLSYNHQTGVSLVGPGCNGYPQPEAGANDYTEDIPDSGLPTRLYNNLGYTGIGESYQPDDYLVTAGFRSKTDISGNPELHPNPNKTMEEQYPALSEKKQQANPQTVIDPQTGEKSVTNNITNYVPVSVPFGSTNGNRSIEHGMNNDDDPESYRDDRSQDDKLDGKVNTNDPIDGYNEDTENAVKDYNDSRNDPAHYPDPIPANEPNPQYPSNPPASTEGDTGDTPSPSAMETVTASGMVSVYNPTKQQLIDFSAWLWSPNFLDNFLKIFANPMDAIIGLHILYATPSTGSAEHIVAGYLDSGVSSKVVNNQFTEIDCGSVDVPEYYGNALDYEPYVQIHVYLPFVGIQALKPNDVIGKKLTIKYGVDALTGTCLATLITEKGESVIACYNFAGNCATQVPVSGGNYSQMITGLASMAVGVGGAIATGNPIMLAGAAVGVMNSHLDVSHSGSIGANAGAMGIRKPYLIITRKSACEAGNYSRFYGYPANKTVILGTCVGYTRIKSLHIDSIPVATDNEIAEIETLLKQGIVIN